jgi:hypothetical protein
MSEENVEEHEEWARKFRAALAPYIGEEELEAAGVFQRPDTFFAFDDVFWMIGNLVMPLFGRLGERLTMGRLGRLRGSFVLAVTREKVRAFTHEGWSGH